MNRRTLIAGLGSPVAWPMMARGQPVERVRRIGVLEPFSDDDFDARAMFSGLISGLAEYGWTDGRNVQIDVRWASGDFNRIQALAKELVSLQPDVLLASTTLSTSAIQRKTKTIPTVFVIVGDPVGSGFVASLSHPGGNLMGSSARSRRLLVSG